MMYRVTGVCAFSAEPYEFFIEASSLDEAFQTASQSVDWDMYYGPPEVAPLRGE